SGTRTDSLAHHGCPALRSERRANRRSRSGEDSRGRSLRGYVERLKTLGRKWLHRVQPRARVTHGSQPDDWDPIHGRRPGVARYSRRARGTKQVGRRAPGDPSLCGNAGNHGQEEGATKEEVTTNK